MLNKEQFVETMTGLCDMYGKVPSEFILDTYYSIFQNYDNKSFNTAIEKCLQNRVYNNLPKPAEILEYLEGTRDDKALVAWLQLKEAVVKGGYYASIEFADPIIANVVNDMGGWTWFCNQEKDDLPFIEKRFMDLYRLLLKRGVKDNPRLVGFIEATNKEKGITHIHLPIRIGFCDEIKQIE